jgi:uncharacterized protein (TIGR03067 family)
MQISNFVGTQRTLKNLMLGWLVIAAVLASRAADAPDSKTVQGAWTPVKAELAGQPLPDAVLKTISLKLHDGQYDVSVAGEPDKGTYIIDPSTKPKSMTVTGTDGPNKGRTFRAIYELEGERLRICYDLSGKQRPAEFKTIVGTRLYLVTYARKKHEPVSAARFLRFQFDGQRDHPVTD